MLKSCFYRIVLLLAAFFIFDGFLLFAKPYKSNVVVSYYAEDFHGKRTSNGENFNMYSLTCAHKSLPFDTVLRITNRANGRSVQVRVNDRGPFVANREVDLSKAAAIKIDMIKSGIARVDIEIIKMGPDTKLSRETAIHARKIMEKKGIWKSTPDNNSSDEKDKEVSKGGSVKKIKQSAPVNDSSHQEYKPGTFWDIQVGAYSKRENANKLAQRLLTKGFKNIVFQKSGDIFRVVIRSVPAEDVRDTEERLKRCGYSNVLIRQRLK